MKPFRHKNVFEEIKNKSHDEDWVALPTKMATAAKPGTAEKIAVLAARLEAGEDLHHPNNERRPGTIEQSSQMQLLVSAARKAKQEQDKAERLAKETKREQRSIKPTKPCKSVYQHKRIGGNARRLPKDCA